MTALLIVLISNDHTEAYSAWFKRNATYILSAVQAAVAALSRSDTCQAAAFALSAICDSCRTELTAHVASFAELVSNLEGQISASLGIFLFLGRGNTYDAVRMRTTSRSWGA